LIAGRLSDERLLLLHNHYFNNYDNYQY